MWIIPSNHPLYSPSALVSLDLKEDLKELSEVLPLQLMWRSKPSSFKIWLRRWKKVYWLRHLFGRMLKPSMQQSFEIKYMESLEDIHASLLVIADLEKGKMIQDTFGRQLRSALKNRGLYGVSLKTSRATYLLVSTLYKRTYTNWVTRLRLDFSRRKKSELHTEETGSLFLRWKTPSSSECEGGTMSKGKIGNAKYKLRDQVSWGTPTVGTNQGNGQINPKKGSRLQDQVLKWPTPTASEKGDYQNVNRDKNGKSRSIAMTLTGMVKNWPTPATRDWKESGQEKAAQERNSPCLPAAVIINGQPDQEKSNIHGKSQGQLNPAWVLQLMGTTLEKTFFVPLVTQSLSNLEK